MSRKKSNNPLKALKLDQVKERKTKNAQKIRKSIVGVLLHEAEPDERQKCFHQLGSNEDIFNVRTVLDPGTRHVLVLMLPHCWMKWSGKSAVHVVELTLRAKFW
ncbi:MAG: hypothetical protein ACAH88_18065 [Roseimicrobium sp.]